jgi:hypothetical protein
LASLDAPDWERVVVTVKATGDVPDAPDWQRIVVGTGGTPVGGGATGSIMGFYSAWGILGITGDPLVFNSPISHAGGNVSMLSFQAFTTGTANNIYTPLNTGSNDFTPNENYVGIYDAGQTTPGTATLLGSSAAGVAESKWTPPQQVSIIPLSSGVPLVGGEMYYIAILNNGANPAFYDTTSDAVVAPNVFGTNPPFVCSTTATHTTLPPTVAFSAMTRVVDCWLAYCGV